MSDPARKQGKARYEDILNLPDHELGEIIDGELHVSPRPSLEHAMASSSLCEELIGPFSKRKGGGPGGWTIVVEPELHLGPDVLVPDLAGWKKERLASQPKNKSGTTVVPDWVCEVLSPSNARLDRVVKVPKYASHGVNHLWLNNPGEKTLEAYALDKGKWVLLSTHAESDKVRVAPFEAIEFDLGGLWS